MKKMNKEDLRLKQIKAELNKCFKNFTKKYKGKKEHIDDFKHIFQCIPLHWRIDLKTKEK